MDEKLEGQHHELRIPAQALHPLIGVSTGPLRELALGLGVDVLPFPHASGRVLLEHGQHEVILAFEVPVDRTGRPAGRLGDVLQRGAVQPALREYLGRGGDQLRPRLLLAVLAPGALRVERTMMSAGQPRTRHSEADVT